MPDAMRLGDLETRVTLVALELERHVSDAETLVEHRLEPLST